MSTGLLQLFASVTDKNGLLECVFFLGGDKKNYQPIGKGRPMDHLWVPKDSHVLSASLCRSTLLSTLPSFPPQHKTLH